MGYLSVYERPGERRGSRNWKGESTYTRMFRVLVDTPNASIDEILAAPGLPGDWWPYQTEREFNLRSLVRTRDPKQHPDNDYLWDVTITYGPPELSQAKSNPDPVMRPPELDWSYENVRKPLVKAVDGQAILNSAKDTFDPPPEIETPEILVFTISKNIPEFDLFVFKQARNKVNATGWNGFPT